MEMEERAGVAEVVVQEGLSKARVVMGDMVVAGIGRLTMTAMAAIRG